MRLLEPIIGVHAVKPVANLFVTEAIAVFIQGKLRWKSQLRQTEKLPGVPAKSRGTPLSVTGPIRNSERWNMLC
jgi:hypothetical protein